MCRRDGLVVKTTVLQVRKARIDSWLCQQHPNVRHRCYLVPPETRKSELE